MDGNHRSRLQGVDNVKRFLSVCILAFLFFPFVVYAEEELAPEYNECIEKAVATLDYVKCNNAAYDYWDSILNKNYTDRIATCKKGENPDLCKKTLQKSQRLWVSYKEAMVDSILQMEGNGSLAQVSVSSFLAEETKKQALLLATDEE